MPKVNDIIEWEEYGSAYKLYIRHHLEKDDKVSLQMVFEDATHDKVTEINIPSHRLKQFLATVTNGLLSRKYEIDL